jgi:hypothetical protein
MWLIALLLEPQLGSLLCVVEIAVVGSTFLGHQHGSNLSIG